MAISRKTWYPKKEKPGRLHNTTRRVLFCGQVLGLLPLFGLNNQISNKLRYTLRSPYTIYYTFSLFGQVLMFLASLNHLCQNEISLDNVANLIFYTSSLISFLILANTGRYWPLLVRTVEKMEKELPPFRKNYSFTITVVITSIIVAGIAEEVFYALFSLHIHYFCNSQNIAENYFKINNPLIFNYTPVTMWKAIGTEIFRLQSTLLWSYNDWLMIIVSLYLTEYFLVHNKRLKKAVQQERFLCHKFRTDYIKIIHLVKLVNTKFGIILFMSVGGNLYWICNQLFNALNGGLTPRNRSTVCKLKESHESTSALGVSYYLYMPLSFTYVVIRALLVLQLTARIQSNAIMPVHLLYELPSSKYNVEVQRYITLIKHFKISLSGLNFFFVTKKMILSVLGTIVTYELVLFQFNKNV